MKYEKSEKELSVMDIKKIITETKTRIEKNGGLKAVYFIGCGGSMAAVYPAEYMVQSEAKNIATALYTSNEFVYSTPKSLDNRCICILCSLKATPDTVEAVRVANERRGNGRLR